MSVIYEILKFGEQSLSAAGIDSPRFDARELLLCALGLESRSELALVTAVSEPQRQHYSALLERRARREPLQYILGFWEFYGRRFIVCEGVLIPRADTETLVEAAISEARRYRAPKILDLCSGSGAIAITLAAELAESRVSAVELSPIAFSVLLENIALHKVSVEAKNEDIAAFSPGTLYDIIVSNPPYVSEEEYAELSPELYFEPKMALLAPQNGLFFYELIAKRYYSLLSPGGALLVECGISQSECVSDILIKNGYREISFVPDLSGVRRVVCGRR